MMIDIRIMLILLSVTVILISGCIGQTPEEPETNTTNMQDSCKDVICEDTAEICDDGFIAACKNKCVDGVCTTCLPDCSDHEEEKCEESWSCTEWSKCNDSSITRTCTDVNNCGTQKNKPSELTVCAPDLPLHVVITEVYYDTIGDDSLQEWIEIYNPTIDNITLDGYYLLDNSNENMKWMFPNGTIIQPGLQLVIARDSVGYKDLFGCTPNLSGFSFQLNNEADKVGLYKDGTLIDMVAWGGEEGWNLTTPNDRSIKRNPLNVDTDTPNDWETNQEAHPGRCFFSE